MSQKLARLTFPLPEVGQLHDLETSYFQLRLTHKMANPVTAC